MEWRSRLFREESQENGEMLESYSFIKLFVQKAIQYVYNLYIK